MHPNQNQRLAVLNAETLCKTSLLPNYSDLPVFRVIMLQRYNQPSPTLGAAYSMIHT